MQCLKLTRWPIVPFNREIIFHRRKVQRGSPKPAFVNSIHFWNKVVHWNVNVLLAAMFTWLQNRLQQLWHIKNVIFQLASKNDVISLAVYLFFMFVNQYPFVNSREILIIFSWKGTVLRWSHCHQDEGIPWILRKFWLINYLRFLVPPPTVEQSW